MPFRSGEGFAPFEGLVPIHGGMPSRYRFVRTEGERDIVKAGRCHVGGFEVESESGPSK